MSIDALISHFGYLAVVVGAFLEGETILVMAALAAHRGYLSLPLVILSAFIGTVCGDQLYFYLGRRHTGYLLRRHPEWRGRVDKMRSLLNRHQILMILSFRFFYGLRTVAPFVIGMSGVPLWQYVVLNVIGAAIWAAAVGCGGYYFGQAAELVIGHIKHFEKWLILGVALVGIGVWSYHFYWKRRVRRNRGVNR